MEVTKKLEPGAHGTRRYLTRYGERLVCVRYRLDRRQRRRLTTVELVVNETPWLEAPATSAEPHPNSLLYLRIEFSETRLREQVKFAGGQWLPERRLWRLPARKVSELGLEKRVVSES